MREAIGDFFKQFEYEPVVENADNLEKRDSFVVVGMGGSHLAADLIRDVDSSTRLIIRSDYGLPGFSKDDLSNFLVILSSYSGNTEEVIDAFGKARDMGLSMAAVSTGGKLLEIAKEAGMPYVQMPSTGIQPRAALGFSFKSMLKLMGRDGVLRESGKLAALEASSFEDEGKALAERFRGRVPVIYTSRDNMSVAYNWKIKLNETGKIPAFYNVLPELNHNEMTGFDVGDITKDLSKVFYFVFLRDEEDHSKILNRMEVTEKLYKDRGLTVEVIDLKGSSRLERIFTSLTLADWAAYYTSQGYGLESEQVPMVEEFKKLIK